MNFDECKAGAHDFLKSNRLLGSELAATSRSFDDLDAKHRKVLHREYQLDYNKPWPGCSVADQWSAVNWENQVYVNSKDPSVTSSCGARKVQTLAALMSHEIYHIKAGSNYCSNETRCLYDHEMMAHIYEHLVAKGSGARLGQTDWRQLSDRVFANYIHGSLQGPEDKKQLVQVLLAKALRRRMDRAGVAKHVSMQDVDLMVKAGQSHFAA